MECIYVRMNVLYMFNIYEVLTMKYKNCLKFITVITYHNMLTIKYSSGLQICLLEHNPKIHYSMHTFLICCLWIIVTSSLSKSVDRTTGLGSASLLLGR